MKDAPYLWRMMKSALSGFNKLLSNFLLFEMSYRGMNYKNNITKKLTTGDNENMAEFSQ